MAHVPVDYPNVPTREQAEFLAVTRGDYPASIADVVNFGNFWKALPLAHHEIKWAGDVLRTSPIGRDDLHRFPFTVQDTDRFRGIVLVVDYQASNLPEGGSDETALLNGVKIDAALLETGGGVLDGPVAFSWDRADNTLHTAAVGHNVLHGPVVWFVGEYWPILQVTTGAILDVAPTAPTSPRPLLVPDTFNGGELVVTLETVNCRLIHVDVWALYEADA